MKYSAREVITKSGWLGITLFGLATVVSVVLADTEDQILDETTTSFIPSTSKLELASSTTKLKYGVAGRVEAKKEIVIRAKQAGTIEEVLVTEGSITRSGEMLALQLDPVLSARLSRQVVASSIAEVGRESALLAKTENASLQEINSFRAIGLATLTNEVSANRTLAVQTQLITNLETLVVSLPQILRFVQDNKTYFRSESNDLYREAVSQLYGKEVDYLRLTSLTYKAGTEESLIKALASANSSTTPTEMVSVTNRALLVLGTLAKVFSEAESEFLDRNQLSSADTTYTAYNETRQNLLALRLALEQSIEALDSVADAGGVNEFSNEISVSTSEVTKNGALEQSRVAQTLLDKTGQLSVADRAVFEAELSLGLVKAPFAGVISEVMVEVGEYVQPGTPLFVLVSVADQEIQVKIPEQFVAMVKIGDNFIIDGRIVGQVDRVVPVLKAGTATIFVKFIETQIIGKVVHGELMMSENGLNTVNRDYLSFDNAGPYVITRSGKKIHLKIIYDNGSELFVEPELPLNDELVPAFGIRL